MPGYVIPRADSVASAATLVAGSFRLQPAADAPHCRDGVYLHAARGVAACLPHSGPQGRAKAIKRLQRDGWRVEYTGDWRTLLAWGELTPVELLLASAFCEPEARADTFLDAVRRLREAPVGTVLGAADVAADTVVGYVPTPEEDAAAWVALTVPSEEPAERAGLKAEARGEEYLLTLGGRRYRWDPANAPESLREWTPGWRKGSGQWDVMGATFATFAEELGYAGGGAQQGQAGFAGDAGAQLARWIERNAATGRAGFDRGVKGRRPVRTESERAAAKARRAVEADVFA